MIGIRSVQVAMDAALVDSDRRGNPPSPPVDLVGLDDPVDDRRIDEAISGVEMNQ